MRFATSSKVSENLVVLPHTLTESSLTPGLRFKFHSGSRLSPWAAIGGGYALYQESAKLSNGQNVTNKFLNRGAFNYRGGLDYRLYRFIGLRGEVRDFVSGNPNLNVRLSSLCWDSSWPAVASL